MLTYPNIDSVALSLGPLKIHWYGLMYLLGFAVAWGLARWRAVQRVPAWTTSQVDDLIFYAAIGVVVGGRLGYMLFYDYSHFLAQPWILFQVWKGGMAFHGGLIGVGVAALIFSKRAKKNWFDVVDFIAPLVPIGLGLGRLGNFMNGELWGRVTHAPWGMVFPNAGLLPRHPSQLYEFFLEGVVLFVLIWLFSARPRPRFAVTALFLLSYGIFRFVVEFFRQPDAQIGFVLWGWMTKGQLLCLPMIVVGVAALVWAYCRKYCKDCCYG